MNIADQIQHTTIRIETQSSEGDGNGTGFFLTLCQDGAESVPVIVTNKHVISGASSGRLHFTLKKNATDEPDIGRHVAVPIVDLQKMWIGHPDPDVDLAVCPVGPLWQALKSQGHTPFFKTFDISMIATQEYMMELLAIEDVVMVGYPRGLWDARHNLPIIRRGITATSCNVNFDGRPQFVIDCACFPGSSGSPVLLFNMGGYVDRSGNTNMGGARVKLLGVLFAGPQFTAKGDIKVVPVPAVNKPISLSNIPMNLGYCVKATELLWFETYFRSILVAEKAAKSSADAHQGSIKPA